jgi:Fe2+ or Zn2+ uptake regulation protein
MQNNFSFALKQLNLKITPRRLAILEILKEESVFLSPEEIWKRLRTRFKKIGLPTVYRNLEELAEGNIISKINHPNRQLYYYLCPNQSPHHHFICLSCHKVEDLNFCILKELEEEVIKKIRGKVLSHILQVNGLCKECFKRSKNDR